MFQTLVWHAQHIRLSLSCSMLFRFDNYISIYVMFAVGALECIGLCFGRRRAQSRRMRECWEGTGA